MANPKDHTNEPDVEREEEPESAESQLQNESGAEDSDMDLPPDDLPIITLDPPD